MRPCVGDAVQIGVDQHLIELPIAIGVDVEPTTGARHSDVVVPVGVAVEHPLARRSTGLTRAGGRRPRGLIRRLDRCGAVNTLGPLPPDPGTIIGEPRLEGAVVVEVERTAIGPSVMVAIPQRIVGQSVAVEVEPYRIESTSPEGQICRRRPGAGPPVTGPEDVLDRRFHEYLDGGGG